MRPLITALAIVVMALASMTTLTVAHEPPPGQSPCYMPDEQPPNCLPWDWEHHETWPTQPSTPTPSSPAATSSTTTQVAPSPTATPSGQTSATMTPSVASSATTATPTPSPCQEDDPCWDCATMGNQICGSVAMLPDTATHQPHDWEPFLYWLFFVLGALTVLAYQAFQEWRQEREDEAWFTSMLQRPATLNSPEPPDPSLTSTSAGRWYHLPHGDCEADWPHYHQG